MDILIRIDSNNQVIFKHYEPHLIEDKSNYIEVSNYVKPIQQEGKVINEYYRNRKIEAEYSDIPFESVPTEEQIKKLSDQSEELNSRLTLTEGALTDLALMILP